MADKGLVTKRRLAGIAMPGGFVMDPDTDAHCARVTRVALALGQRLGLAGDDIGVLALGARIHDIGKVIVPQAILEAPRSLTAAERAIVRQHAAAGELLCRQITQDARIRGIVRSHHERLDGTGYPDNLRGDAIPFLAQVVSLIDAFDALTAGRPYHKSVSVERACEILADEARWGWRRVDLVEELAALQATSASGADTSCAAMMVANARTEVRLSTP